MHIALSPLRFRRDGPLGEDIRFGDSYYLTPNNYFVVRKIKKTYGWALMKNNGKRVAQSRYEGGKWYTETTDRLYGDHPKLWRAVYATGIEQIPFNRRYEAIEAMRTILEGEGVECQ